MAAGRLYINENTATREKYLYNDYSTDTKQAADIGSYELTYLAGIGATYKLFTLELRYEYGDGLLKTISTTGVKNAMYLMAGIRL